MLVCSPQRGAISERSPSPESCVLRRWAQNTRFSYKAESVFGRGNNMKYLFVFMEEKFKDKKINITLTRVNVNLNIAWEHFLHTFLRPQIKITKCLHCNPPPTPPSRRPVTCHGRWYQNDDLPAGSCGHFTGLHSGVFRPGNESYWFSLSERAASDEQLGAAGRTCDSGRHLDQLSRYIEIRHQNR